MDDIIEIDKYDDQQDDLKIEINGPQVPQHTLMEISPNGNYIVVYSEGKKFVGWNVKKDEEKNIQLVEYVVNEEEDIKIELEGYEKESENIQVENDSLVVVYNREERIRHMCVSDNMILAYIYDYDGGGSYIKIIDMVTGQKIKLYFKFDKMEVQFCNFNLKGELILWCTGETNIRYNNKHRTTNIVCVYSIKVGKTKCQKIYTIPIEAEVINISKDDKIWMRFNNDIYEWDIPTAHNTITLKNVYWIKTKEIKISNNKEYTCFKLINEKIIEIIVYSNQLGFPIATFELTYLKDSKDPKDERKRDKLIKRLYNLMIDQPSLRCLLLSLLDSSYLNELIENSPTFPDQSSENSSNLLNIFYRSKQHNYIFVHNDHRIQVDEFGLKKKLKASNYEYEYLSFSGLKNQKDVLGKYQLEKGSMLWKFKVEELEKQKITSIVELMLVKNKTNNVVNDLKDQINKLVRGEEKSDVFGIMTERIYKFKERLGKFKRWRSDDDLVKDFEIRINEMKKWRDTFVKSIENSNPTNEESAKVKTIKLIEELIEDVDKEITEQIKQKIKIKLENYFVGQIIEKRFDEHGKQLAENFIDLMKQDIIKFENPKENGYFNILVDELKRDTKDFFKKFGAMFKEKHIVEDFDKLKIDFDKLKGLVKDIIGEIRDAKGTTYITYAEEIDKMKYSDGKRIEKTSEFIKIFIKVTKIEVSVKKFIKQINGLEKDYFINVELTDIDTAVKKTMENFIKEITDKGNQNRVITDDSKTNIGIKAMEKFIKEIVINVDEKGSNESVKNFIKMIISTKNDDISEGLTIFEGLVNDNDNDNYIFKELMNNFIKEIEKIKVEEHNTRAISNDTNIIDDIEKATIKESARKFIEGMLKIKIDRFKEDFITEIEDIKGIELVDRIIRKPVNKFIKVIDAIGPIADMTEFEKSVNEFITPKISTLENTMTKKEIAVAKIKKPVKKFIEWTNKSESDTNINKDNKRKKLESLIKEIEITEIKELMEDPINLADDFIEYIKTKIELGKKPYLVMNIIRDIGKIKIDELNKKIEKITEDTATKLINDIVILRINEELVKDSMEQITKFKKLENDYGKWNELKRDFIKRKNMIEELAKESNKFEIEIDEKSLKANKDLIRLFCTNRDLDADFKSLDILAGKLFNSNEIAMLTNIGFFVFHLNKDVRLNYKDHENRRIISKSYENDKLISLNYFYYIHQPKQSIEKIHKMIGQLIKKGARYKVFNVVKKVISFFRAKHVKIEEEINCDKLIYGWVSFIKNNNEVFLKYGNALLMFAIEINDLELIDSIYKKCIDLFNQDLKKNKAFLSIITTSMPLLNENLPEYVTKFSLDTNMIIDSPDYKIEYLSTSHLYPFSDIKIVDLTRSVFWTKYAYQVRNMRYYHSRGLIRFLMWIYFSIESLIFRLGFPISFTIFHILSYFNIINEMFADRFSKLYYKYHHFISNSIFPPEKPKPTITFIIPYIKFVSYPQCNWRELRWWKELLIKPEPSPFAKTINSAIYKTWNGEALVNFKWNLYGKYYHFVIWIIFTTLLGCFTAATTLSKELIPDDTRDRLLIASMILGFIHLSFELRQFIYDPIEWIFDPWNYFDLGAYLVPTFTSIYWLYTDDEAHFLISISCLLLDLKFLLFFRAYNSFGIYFVIIVDVAKKIASFLVILFVILVSFAHAFFVLLKPRNVYSLTEPPSEDNDPNNPWSLTESYYQGNSSNPSFIQQPDKNTNLFTDYTTSLFSMYLYLTGDSNSLSNWEYKDNPPIAILMILFSLFITVYLMNLLIGLLNNAIGQDTSRTLHFMQKAKILAEIELFYLFPNQRRWKAWFPDVIYYHAHVDKTQKRIREHIDNNEWNSDEFQMLKEKLLISLKIQDRSNLLDDIRIKIDKIDEQTQS